MATKSLQDLNTRRESLITQLAKLDKEIAQAGFVDGLKPGVYVYGKLNDGTEFTHARLLGKTEAQGTSGEWFKLRLNEDTAEEQVKSVRLSNIDGVEGVVQGADAPADANVAADKPVRKTKELAADEI